MAFGTSVTWHQGLTEQRSDPLIFLGLWVFMKNSVNMHRPWKSIGRVHCKFIAWPREVSEGFTGLGKQSPRSHPGREKIQCHTWPMGSTLAAVSFSYLGPSKVASHSSLLSVAFQDQLPGHKGNFAFPFCVAGGTNVKLPQSQIAQTSASTAPRYSLLNLGVKLLPGSCGTMGSF